MPAELKISLKDAVLDAAERLLGRLGFQKMTMDDIAREAGVGKRTIYLHFTGKEDVALRTIDRIARRVEAAMLEIAGSEAPAAEKLRDMLRARVLIRLGAVHDYYMSLDEILATLRKEYMARRQSYFETERALLEQVLRSGDFDVEDKHVAAEALIFATNSLLPHSLSVREMGLREEITTRVDAIANLMIRGLTNREETQ